MAKLWQKEPNREIERFTVGDDFILDRNLLKYDCLGSIAHAKMLCKIGILTKEEMDSLVCELNKIIKMKDNFAIKQSDEDCHTAIENYLTEKLGNMGKKIHTGRSRNDQILTAIRLYEKNGLKEIKLAVLNLIKTLACITEKHHDTAIPGYTHMQKAMPSTIAMLFNAYSESLKDDAAFLDDIYAIIDQSPLGSAAGYGINLYLDREMCSSLLGFKKVQYTTYVQNSRGKFEFLVLSKMSADLLLFSTAEFGYFSLPEKLTTGSSIMPQKKNPDVLELIRAKSKLVAGYLFQADLIQKDLISGYNRDLQLIKEPLFRSFAVTEECLKITDLVLNNLIINKEKCKAACTEDIYKTDKALDLVKKGFAFRDAYKQIKEQPE